MFGLARTKKLSFRFIFCLVVLVICLLQFLSIVVTLRMRAWPEGLRCYDQRESGNKGLKAAGQAARVAYPDAHWDAPNAAFIVELSSVQQLLAKKVLHFARVLPQDWLLLVLHTRRTSDFLKRAVADLWSGTGAGAEGELTLAELVRAGRLALVDLEEGMGKDFFDLGYSSFSCLLSYPELWQLFPKAEWVLVFHLDSVACSGTGFTLSNFTRSEKVDFYGAPAVGSDYLNGGLSLRRRATMESLTRARGLDHGPEDVYFRNAAELEGVLDRFASLPVGATFSTESILAARSWGAHDPMNLPWRDRHLLLRHCPEAWDIFTLHWAGWLSVLVGGLLNYVLGSREI